MNWPAGCVAAGGKQALLGIPGGECDERPISLVLGRLWPGRSGN